MVRILGGITLLDLEYRTPHRPIAALHSHADLRGA